MSANERGLERLLTLAQAAASPTPAQQVRSFERLEASTEPLALVARPLAPATAPRLPANVPPLGMARSALWAGTVLGFGAAIAYLVARAAADATPEPQRLSPPALTATGSAGDSAPLPHPHAHGGNPSASPLGEPQRTERGTPDATGAGAPLASEGTPEVTSPSSAEVARPSRHAPAVPRRMPRRASSSKTPAAQASLAAPSRTATSEYDLSAALRRLRSAQSALRDGDATGALEQLDRLDSEVPEVVLGEERQVTRILAWCEAGQRERAVALARRLLSANPNSAYAGRVEQSCAAESTTLLEEMRRR